MANRKTTTEPCLPINPELGKPEHDEWRWCTMSELSELLRDRLNPVYSYLQKIV
jgi:bis(5'-nucleosidyl)-tetraphosphatase